MKEYNSWRSSTRTKVIGWNLGMSHKYIGMKIEEQHIKLTAYTDPEHTHAHKRL